MLRANAHLRLARVGVLGSGALVGSLARMCSTIVTTRTGLKYKDVLVPPEDARKPQRGETVHVHYEGRLESGELFDSSYSRDKPISFQLGRGQARRQPMLGGPCACALGSGQTLWRPML